MIIASDGPNLRTDFNKRDFKIEVIQVRSLVIESFKERCLMSDSSFVIFLILTSNMEKQKQKQYKCCI